MKKEQMFCLVSLFLLLSYAQIANSATASTVNVAWTDPTGVKSNWSSPQWGGTSGHYFEQVDTSDLLLYSTGLNISIDGGVSNGRYEVNSLVPVHNISAFGTWIKLDMDVNNSLSWLKNPEIRFGLWYRYNSTHGYWNEIYYNTKGDGNGYWRINAASGLVWINVTENINDAAWHWIAIGADYTNKRFVGLWVDNYYINLTSYNMKFVAEGGDINEMQGYLVAFNNDESFGNQSCVIAGPQIVYAETVEDLSSIRWWKTHGTLIMKSRYPITSSSYTDKQLTFVLTGQSGDESKVSVYCGSLGKPFKVEGDASWSYNGVSKILTVYVLHHSPETITVTWIPPQTVKQYYNVIAPAFGLMALAAAIAGIALALSGNLDQRTIVTLLTVIIACTTGGLIAVMVASAFV